MFRRLRRRPFLLLLASTAILIAAATPFVQPYVWSPLSTSDLVATSPPELPAPLRTPAEHDAHYPDSRPRIFGLSPPGHGTLTVLGCEHTSDPMDAQLAALRTQFDATDPTLVLVEGRLGWWLGGEDAMTRRFGESGTAAAIARARGIPVASLEPELAGEVGDAVAAFGAEKVLAFYTLRVFVAERDAGLLGDDLDSEAEALLHKRARKLGLDGVLPDLAALDRFWADASPPHPDWRSLPRELLWRAPDGPWPKRVAERINRYRDRHMVAVMTAAVARGERVLAVCGKSHLILFEPPLTAAIEALGR